MPFVMGQLIIIAALTSRATSQHIPAMHFGCNASGPENATQLAALLNYETVVFEFRHQMDVKPWNREESVLEEQAVALKRFAEQQRRPIPQIFVYWNVNAGSMFALQRQIMFDPAYDHFFLSSPSVDPTLNISWRAFNFSNSEAATWYLEHIVAEAANESVREKTDRHTMPTLFSH